MTQMQQDLLAEEKRNDLQNEQILNTVNLYVMWN